MRRDTERDGDCGFWFAEGKPNQHPGNHGKDERRGN
jgi:hypothetical protein